MAMWANCVHMVCMYKYWYQKYGVKNEFKIHVFFILTWKGGVFHFSCNCNNRGLEEGGWRRLTQSVSKEHKQTQNTNPKSKERKENRWLHFFCSIEKKERKDEIQPWSCSSQSIVLITATNSHLWYLILLLTTLLIII